MSVYAIITARGGSKQLPRKNVALLAGVPLIAYSIEAARHCHLVDACFVSTEDPEIKEISLAWGAQIIDRPASLAQDDVSSEAVIRHTLAHLAARGALPESFVLLQPTSPLRTSVHLQECLELYLRSGANSMVSVTEVEHHPFKCFRQDGESLVPLFEPSFLTARRQDLPKVVRPNGAIFVCRTSTFVKSGLLMGAPLLPYMMEQEDSVDIDSAHDLGIAEYLLSLKQSS